VEHDNVPGAAGDGSDGAREVAADAAAAPESDIDVLRAENAQLQDRLLRLAADHDNYRKRTAREWREQKDRAAAEVLREMLELADNLKRALEAPTEDAEGLRKGVELIAQQLQVKLKRFGVEPIEAEGAEFDPTRHEAMLMVDSDSVDSHRVVDVVQPGYTLHGEVLRPARVTVAR